MSIKSPYSGHIENIAHLKNASRSMSVPCLPTGTTLVQIRCGTNVVKWWTKFCDWLRFALNSIVKTYWMKREACLQGNFVVKMYWLKRLHNCRNGAFVGSANLTWQRWGWFWLVFFHIFGNNLKIRPVRAIKISDGTTPHGDLSYDIWHLICKNPPSGLGDLRTKLVRRKRKKKIKRKKKKKERFLQFALDSVKAN